MVAEANSTLFCWSTSSRPTHRSCQDTLPQTNRSRGWLEWTILRSIRVTRPPRRTHHCRPACCHWQTYQGVWKDSHPHRSCSAPPCGPTAVNHYPEQEEEVSPHARAILSAYATNLWRRDTLITRHPQHTPQSCAQDQIRREAPSPS